VKREIRNLTFWGRPMNLIRPGEWFIRLMIGNRETVGIVRRGNDAGYRLGNQPIIWLANKSVIFARNAAERYLEKLATDIARESVRR
jgi:hypothetical protein